MTFEEYVQAHRMKLLRFGAVLSGDGGLAEDLVQTVLTRAYQQWERVSAADSPHAYVRRMIVNEFLSWRRRRLRLIPVSDLGDLAPQQPDHAERHAERVSLLQLLTRLPARQRAVVVLRYYEELSHSEIAAVLGVEESTVRSNLSRALTALRIEVDADTGASAPRPAAVPIVDAFRTERS